MILVKILAPGFYARQNVVTPVKIGLVTLVATQAMNFAFIGPLKHAGLALAIGLGACLNALLLYWFLRKQNIYAPQPGWLAFALKVARVGARHGGGALARDGPAGAVAAGGLAVEGRDARRPGAARRRGLRRLPARARLPAARFLHAGCRMTARELRAFRGARLARGRRRSTWRAPACRSPRTPIPGLDVDGYVGEIERFARRLRARLAPDALGRGPGHRAERVPVRRPGLPRQHRRLLRSAQLLPERGARPPHRHPDHAVGALHGDRPAHRAAARGRVLPGAFPGAPADARRHAGARPVRRRRAAVRGRAARAPEARDPARGAGRRPGRRPAARPVPRAGEQAPDPRAPAAQPEGRLPREGQARAPARRCSTA